MNNRPIEMPPVAIEVMVRVYVNGAMHVISRNKPPEIIYALECAKFHCLAGPPDKGSGAPDAEPKRLWSPGGP